MIRGKDDSVSDVWLNRTGIWRRLFLRRMGRSLPGFLFYYVGNIACDISGITRKSTAENPIGAADFLICITVLTHSGIWLFLPWIEIQKKDIDSPPLHRCCLSLSLPFLHLEFSGPAGCVRRPFLADLFAETDHRS